MASKHGRQCEAVQAESRKLSAELERQRESHASEVATLRADSARQEAALRREHSALVAALEATTEQRYDRMKADLTGLEWKIEKKKSMRL